MADHSTISHRQAAEAFLAKALPAATAANPKYRSGDGGELTAWLTKSIRFAPTAKLGGVSVAMSEEAVAFRDGARSAVNAHEATFAIEDVHISEYRYPADVTEAGEPAIGILIKCDSGKCIRSKWNGAESSTDQADLYVYDATARAKILEAFNTLKNAAGNRA